jgi:uncharacterized membrane protein
VSAEPSPCDGAKDSPDVFSGASPAAQKRAVVDPPTASHPPQPRGDSIADVDDLALFFHVLGALLLFAGLVLASAAFEVARRREHPSEIALLLGLTRIGVALVGVGTLLLIAFGIWLVQLAHLSYGTGWISTSIVLYIVALGLGAVGGRRPKQARRLAATLGSENAAPRVELYSLLNDPVSRAANYASAALVVAILVLMVFKP